MAAAEPWSAANHALFPAAARARAADLARIGYLLAWSPRYAAEARSLTDCWTSCVMAHAVTRHGCDDPEHPPPPSPTGASVGGEWSGEELGSDSEEVPVVDMSDAAGAGE